MGWQSRNRIADLRDAPINGRQQTPVAVQVDYAQLANTVCATLSPGAPVPWQHTPGIQPVMIPMPDMQAMARELAKKLDTDFGPDAPPDLADQLAIVMAVADLQTAYARIAKRWNERHAPAGAETQDALPEPPEDRAPMRLLEDEPGRDANGSPVE